MTQQTNSNSKVWLGIFLVTIGSYFLLRNLNLIPSFLPYWMFGWESILILAGGADAHYREKRGIDFPGHWNILSTS